MIKRLIAGGKRIVGLHHPGRNLKVFPDDVFLVSYPEVGQYLDALSDREPGFSREVP